MGVDRRSTGSWVTWAPQAEADHFCFVPAGGGDPRDSRLLPLAPSNPKAADTPPGERWVREDPFESEEAADRERTL